ncbi:unnamed protein product, partial [Prorocentrum cordatum]
QEAKGRSTAFAAAVPWPFWPRPSRGPAARAAPSRGGAFSRHPPLVSDGGAGCQVLPLEVSERPRQVLRQHPGRAVGAGVRVLHQLQVLLNFAEVFPRIVRAKLRAAGRSDRAIGMAGRGGRLVADLQRFGARFSDELAGKLTAILPQQLEEQGIQLEMSQVHCGTMGFVVIRCEVLEVDLVQLLEKARGTSFADKLRPLIGLARRLGDVDRRLVPKIQHQMMLKLEQEIPAMLKEKVKIDMLVVTKPSSEQADFFFGALAPHRVEVEITLLNAAEIAPRIARERAKGRFGSELGRGKLLGMAAGAVASTAVARVPDRVFGQLVARRLSARLTEKMAEVGVTACVVEKLISVDRSGRTVLRCEVVDVDLCVFRGAAEAVGAWNSRVDGGRHFLKLGHKGRSDIYKMLRNYISSQFPEHLKATSDILISVDVRDVQHGNVEMLELDFSDSETESMSSQVDDATSTEPACAVEQHVE